MQKRRIRSVFLFLLLLGVLYNLYIASSNRWTSIEIQKNKNRERNSKVIYPSHYSMPSLYKGKQLPFHQVYEPREVGFPADMQTPKVYNKTKLILVWTSWNSLHKTINYYFLQGGSRSFVEYNCPNPNCRVTFKRKNLRKADAILFHLIDTKAEDLPPHKTSSSSMDSIQHGTPLASQKASRNSASSFEQSLQLDHELQKQV
ncbi:glycoprotein 3-alpha-L-fucosyltransferase A [Caerostris extrusa]|uniref:Glycoprotein 3-alpha-L-fucosyltransferase A n=1 Tax=Caerostris extrusa TaxID=172846 RepID=A0AAV4R1R8_CAEEX|nr:glycoprotein 3-alpha-L-fucosyltransferase A [Caerostris extrusa]